MNDERSHKKGNGAPPSSRTAAGGVTPILVKGTKELDWPEDESFFYLLAREGLYLCRQNEFFRSCVKAKDGPSELESQQPFYEPLFPKIPREIIEQAVGFFAEIAELHGSEAAALLVWDRGERRVRLLVPRQTATMSESASGYRYPIGVHYEPPTSLPEGCVIFGDIHSHVDGAAYASYTDVQDELHSAGLHIVVGRIHSEPPELHVEAVVDTRRFSIPPERVIEGYHERRGEVPSEWIDCVAVEVERTKWSVYSSSYSVS
jgi:proteasome lid subunit RPN8/RPN11